jgi:hypothetical protein
VKSCIALPRAHRGSPGLNGPDDVVVTGATTNIAIKLRANRMFVDVVAVSPNHIDGRHDHPRRAKSALQAVIFVESLLHGMQSISDGKAFDRGDAGAIACDRERGAGLDRHTVHMDRAGAALAGIATDMGSRQPQMVAQELHQQGTAFNFGAAQFTIYGYRYSRHCHS